MELRFGSRTPPSGPKMPGRARLPGIVRRLIGRIIPGRDARKEATDSLTRPRLTVRVRKTTTRRAWPIRCETKRSRPSVVRAGSISPVPRRSVERFCAKSDNPCADRFAPSGHHGPMSRHHRKELRAEAEDHQKNHLALAVGVVVVLVIAALVVLRALTD